MNGFTTIRVDTALSKDFTREARKRGVSKEELVGAALKYYLNIGIDVDDKNSKGDMKKAVASLTDEMQKLRGAFFSYFKVHEKGYSMGTLKILWLIVGHLRVLERNSYLSVQDSVLTTEEINELLRENKDIKDAHENTEVPEKFYKGNVQQQGE